MDLSLDHADAELHLIDQATEQLGVDHAGLVGAIGDQALQHVEFPQFVQVIGIQLLCFGVWIRYEFIVIVVIEDQTLYLLLDVEVLL